MRRSGPEINRMSVTSAGTPFIMASPGQAVTTEAGIPRPGAWQRSETLPQSGALGPEHLRTRGFRRLSAVLEVLIS